MITLNQLIAEYGYQLLTDDEIIAIRNFKINWDGLDGEVVLRKCIKSYPAYLQCVNYGYKMTPYHYSMASNLQRDFERGPNPTKGLERLVNMTVPYDPSRPDFHRMPYGLILLSAPPQTGKGASKKTPVLTTRGWTTHGDLKIGDHVFGTDGNPKLVTHVHPDYVLPNTSINFESFSINGFSPQHLWNVNYTDRSSKPASHHTLLVESRQIMTPDIRRNGRPISHRYLTERSPYINVAKPLNLPEAKLPIDPYLFGLWLGDGYSTTGEICGMEADILEYGLVPHRESRTVKIAKGIPSTVLRQLKLYDNKHIPDYMFLCSERQRRELLNGLMDTDGNVSSDGRGICEISLANHDLALQVFSLIQTLGYKANITTRVTKNQTEGFEGVATRVVFFPDKTDKIFKLRRKQTLLENKTTADGDTKNKYFIKSVTGARDGEPIVGNCITVDGDGTYLIGYELLPTHNSLTITESFQSWCLFKYPRLGVLTLGYASDFASRFGRRNREKFMEYAPKLTHGRVKIHDKVQSTEEWETVVLDKISKLYVNTNGGMSCAGLRGVVTGKTGNVVVIDDPVKNMQDALSEVMIEGNIEAYQSTVETRLLGNPGSLCIVMATRWVPNDLIGWLRRHRKDFIVGDYNYAALATDDNVDRDPLKRMPGEGICPEMGKDAHWAEVIRESYLASAGAHVYNAMFQGNPSLEQGNLFKSDDWQDYDINKHWSTEEQINKFDRIYLSVDATFKDLTTSDFVAMELTGIKQGNSYLRYLVRKQMDLPDTIDKILYLVKKFPEIQTIYVEDKANGPGIIQVIKKWRVKLGIPEKDFPSVVPVEPEGGKYSRAQTASVYQRDHRCFMPAEHQAHLLSCEDDFVWEEKGLSYTQCYKQELGTFPYAANDDLVDAFSQGIKKNIGLLSGIEKKEAQVMRFTRYSTWWPEMWADYKQLKSQDLKNEFIRLHGAPVEWKPKEVRG